MNITRKKLLLSAISLAALLAIRKPVSAATCESLSGLALPHASITAAQSITGGTFTPPGSATPLTGLPPFCRVAVTSTPTSDSIIDIEVWIPSGGGWNGKYEQLGCGGFCGSIAYPNLAKAIGRGYAAAATDDGSQAGGFASFALGHSEKIIDFAYRAIKETTDTAKAITTAIKGNGPDRSYFNGCSDGGREALMEAQRFPDDFDGIIVGSPADAWTHLFAGFIWNEQALLGDSASYIPPSLLAVLSNAALAQCARQDGGVAGDPFLNDPRDCKFDPTSVQCRTGQDPATCLSAAQVQAARRIYRGPHNPNTGQLIFPGYEPGSESNASNWPTWIVGASLAGDLSGNRSTGQAFQEFYGNGFFADFVFQNPSFDFHTFNFTSDLAYADMGVGQIINSIDPDLRAFKRHGGKMIQYVGWADAAIAPMNSINYYNQVRGVFSREAKHDHDDGSLKEIQGFYRLFMVPGMAHCSEGDGPNAFGNNLFFNHLDAPVNDAEHDLLAALDRWVEQGIAPDKIIGTHYVNNNPAGGIQFQRPLCPFPQVARYNGVGDPSNANSFTCVNDERDRDPRDLNLAHSGSDTIR